jgi:hypothetical protein
MTECCVKLCRTGMSDPHEPIRCTHWDLGRAWIVGALYVQPLFFFF